MAQDMSVEEKLKLINNNLQEVLNPEIIEKCLREKGTFSLYWGTATTGRPHCGYFVPMLKVAEFLRAGLHVKILLADIHAFLDAQKAPFALVKDRAKYYEFCITNLLKSCNVPIDKLEIILHSKLFEEKPGYKWDILRMSTVVTANDARRAGAEVVKQTDNFELSGLIYPVMQALDEEYLEVDAQFGGVDQRKIFILAKEFLPKLNYRTRAHLMNPMVPGLQGGKMSASDPDSKIDLLDPPDVVKRKLKKAFAAPREVENNGILSFAEFVLLPAGVLRWGEPRFVVERRDAEPLIYKDIKAMQEDYRNDVLSPQMLKAAVTDALNELLQPIQKAYQESKEWQELTLKAYPPAQPEKKEKKKKDKGTRYPGAGAAKVEAKPDGHVEGPDEEKVSVGTSAQEALEKLDLAKQ